MRIKSLLFSIFLVLAAGYSAVLFTQRTFQTSVLTAAEQARNPDSFMTNIHYRAMDAKGRLHTDIIATKMVHYAYQNSSDFIAPDMTLYKDGQINWKVKSDTGRSLFGLEKVTLYSNVVIDHLLKTNKTPPMTLTSSEFTFYPNHDFGETDKAVTITKAGNTIQGIGLQADLTTGNIKLMSQVHSKYQKTE